MSPIDFDEYLEKRYYDQLRYYKSAVTRNRKRYKTFQWLLIVLSTLTTILAALPDIEGFDIKYLVVASAALTTIFTSGIKTFKYQELWVNYRSALEQLKPEIYYYNFNVDEYGQPGIDKEALFVARVEKILNVETDGWPAIKKAEDHSKKKPDQQEPTEEDESGNE